MISDAMPHPPSRTFSMLLSSPPRCGLSAVLRATALSMAFLATTSALAQQNLHKDDWSFNLFNDSSLAIRAFQTEDMTGSLSRNWLDQPMAPDTGMTMEFNDPLDTRCEILTRVVFQNGATLDGYIDYCGTAIVQVTNDGLFFE